eukprot:764291-Karenia_brevis.AAC.1
MVNIWMKPFFHMMPKPSILCGTLPTIHDLERSWSAKGHKKQLQTNAKKCSQGNFFSMFSLRYKLRRRFDPSVPPRPQKEYLKHTKGKWKVSGGRDLSSSASYTPAFAEAILKSHVEMLFLKHNYYDWFKDVNKVSAWLGMFRSAGFLNSVAALEASVHRGEFTFKPEFLKVRKSHQKVKTNNDVKSGKNQTVPGQKLLK